MKEMWFRRKRYGWGWYPADRRGWYVIVAYLALVTLGSFAYEGRPVARIVMLVALTALLVWVSYAKGERPRWQWGDDSRKPEDDKK